MTREVPKHMLVAARQRQNRRRGVLEDLEAIFGAPPVLQGEDELAYLDLASRIRAAMQPRDVIEEIYARDVADLQWDISRDRRAIATLQSTATRRAALRLIWSANADLANRLDRDARVSDTKVFAELDRLGLSYAQAHAEGFAQCLDQVERISALMIKRENRRDAIIREFDRRRHLARTPDALARGCETVRALPRPASEE